MKTIPLLFALLVSAPIFAHADDGILTAQAPVELTGTKGKFDFIKVDAANRRLLACHTGNDSLDVIDLDKSTLVKSIPTGAAQGVAIDEKGGRYFVSCSKPPKLVIVDSKTLAITGEVDLPAPADLCAYCAATDRVLVDNDEKPQMWEIDPVAKKIELTNELKGAGMEDLVATTDSQHFVQALKDVSQIAVFSVQQANGEKPTVTLDRMFASAPAGNPHGMAMVNDKAVLIAGSPKKSEAGAGKLALVDFMSGKVMASGDIAPRVDEIAYDADTGRVYCASGTGTISVVFVQHDKLTPLPALKSEADAHSVAVDPKTHSVWIAYAKDGKPFVQQYATK